MIAGSSSMMIRTSSVSAAKIPMPATSLPSVTGHTTGEGSVRVQRHGPTAVLPDDRTALCLERLRRSFQQDQGISPRLRESAVHRLIGDHRKFAVIHYQAAIESAGCSGGCPSLADRAFGGRADDPRRFCLVARWIRRWGGLSWLICWA